MNVATANSVYNSFFVNTSKYRSKLYFMWLDTLKLYLFFQIKSFNDAFLFLKEFIFSYISYCLITTYIYTIFSIHIPASVDNTRNLGIPKKYELTALTIMVQFMMIEVHVKVWLKAIPSEYSEFRVSYNQYVTGT